MSTPASSAQQFRTFLKCPLDLAAAGLRRPAVLLENAVICHRAAPVQSTHAAGIGCSRIDEARGMEGRRAALTSVGYANRQAREAS